MMNIKDVAHPSYIQTCNALEGGCGSCPSDGVYKIVNIMTRTFPHNKFDALAKTTSTSARSHVEPHSISSSSRAAAVEGVVNGYCDSGHQNMTSLPVPPPLDELRSSSLMDRSSEEGEESIDDVKEHQTNDDDICATDNNELLQHSFEPGDHVIRWEMLPIVYPIQIHGIVLDCGENYVTIADFGLTSYVEEATTAASEQADPTNENDQRERGNETSVTRESAVIEIEGMVSEESRQPSNNSNKNASVVMDKTLQQQKLHPSHNKSRLNVITIRDVKDIRAWKKVNYGQNMFSNSFKKSKSWWRLGSMKDEEEAEEVVENMEKVTEEINETSAENDQATRLDAGGTTCGNNDTHALSEEAMPTLSEQQQPMDNVSTDKIDPSPTFVDSSDFENTSKTLNDSTLDEPKMTEQLTEKANKVKQTIPQSPPKASLRTGESSSEQKTSRPWWHPPSRKFSSNSMTVSENKNEEGTSTKPNWWMSWTASNHDVPDEQQVEEKEIAWADAGRPQLSQRHMNPAMSSLMAKSSSKEQPQKPQQKLPKADPPKVVLARARFLLEHGESVLPPYHVFASNSECIAVWCMTGRWSTLQASVFLHSTAIGHAKTATAITLGVAATQPWLVPALAVVGGAAVGMPWIILKRSKDRWEEATVKLNDLFWAQAEPEVFVECIEKWSGLKRDTVASLERP